ncbi:VOC family protein [Streptomyces niveus]|uniref:VOC family protein n=1 Tax=Streptomyces niveus TaxID=193462 RepID=UPI0034456384
MELLAGRLDVGVPADTQHGLALGFLRIDDFPVIVIQHAPGHVPPQWPDGTSQQMHVDLTSDDVATADRRVLDGGGRRLRPGRKGPRVYASPARHPFCVRPA